MNMLGWRSTLSVSLTFFMVVFWVGCGGGGSKSSPPPQPPVTLTFTSTPPTSASEGTAYSYNIQTSTPATFALTGPAGATITNGALAWTPTPAQARMANNFTVTATAGTQVVTQTWSVTPTGTIRGTTADACVSDSGQVTNVNSTVTTVTMFTPKSTGTGFDSTSVSVAPDGTFMFPNIGPGSFWLVTSGNTGVWTSSNNVDFGNRRWGGCTNESTATVGTSIDGTVSGLDPWQTGDIFYFAVPNEKTRRGANAILSGTSLTFKFVSSTLPLLDASKGDNAYFAQLVTSNHAGLPFAALARFAGPQPITIQDATANPVSGTLQALAQTQTFRANIQGSAFAALHAAMNPNGQPTNVSFNLSVEEAVEATSYLKNGLYLVLGGQSFQTDTDAGDIAFANPYPNTWTPIVQYVDSYEYDLAPQLGAGWATMLLVTSTVTTQFPTATKPIAPIVGPVLNPKVNNSDLFAAQNVTLSSNTLGLSWQQPSVGTATSYMITVYSVDINIPAMNQIGMYFTNSTSATIPAGNLNPGQQYVILITALNRQNDATIAPTKIPLPMGLSDVGSGVLTIQ